MGHQLFRCNRWTSWFLPNLGKFEGDAPEDVGVCRCFCRCEVWPSWVRGPYCYSRFNCLKACLKMLKLDVHTTAIPRTVGKLVKQWNHMKLGGKDHSTQLTQYSAIFFNIWIYLEGPPAYSSVLPAGHQTPCRSKAHRLVMVIQHRFGTCTMTILKQYIINLREKNETHWFPQVDCNRCKQHLFWGYHMSIYSHPGRGISWFITSIE